MITTFISLLLSIAHHLYIIIFDFGTELMKLLSEYYMTFVHKALPAYPCHTIARIPFF